MRLNTVLLVPSWIKTSTESITLVNFQGLVYCILQNSLRRNLNIDLASSNQQNSYTWAGKQ